MYVVHACISVCFSIVGFSYVVTLMRGISATYFVFILYICVWVYWGDGNKCMYGMYVYMCVGILGGWQ